MISLDLIARWPGKSAGENGIEHPAIYHMIDVAAVAEILLQQTDFPVEHRAALMLAQRMLLAGKGQGLFFALATMATADAMFSRVSTVIGGFFHDRPTVTLAHGRAALSDDFRDLKAGRPNAPQDAGCTE